MRKKFREILDLDKEILNFFGFAMREESCPLVEELILRSIFWNTGTCEGLW